MMRTEGKKRITRRKLTGISIPAKYPKADMGIISLKPVAMKAAEVVDDVASIAREALLKVIAILWFNLVLGSLSNCSYKAVYSQASTNTNISSAAIPKTMKIAQM